MRARASLPCSWVFLLLASLAIPPHSSAATNEPHGQPSHSTCLPGAPPAPAAHTSSESSLTPEAALRLMREGNERYVAWSPVHPRVNQATRDLAATGQHPFAAVLSCADSRVPPELLFDRGIGDLFVVRIAGNVAGEHEIGSLEYAVDHLGVPVIVVMGHTRCGAVTAAIEGGKAPGAIPSLLESIQPAVIRARAAHPEASPGLLLTCTIELNVWHSVETMIRQSAILREKLSAGEVRIVGAMYDIESGRVDWLGSHPNQGEFMNPKLSERVK